VARACERVGDDDAARRVWELIRAVHPGDQDANYALANVYRRLDRPDLSEQAIKRALENRSLTPHMRAELYGLLASNVKRKWVRQWRKASEQDKASKRSSSPTSSVSWLRRTRAGQTYSARVSERNPKSTARARAQLPPVSREGLRGRENQVRSVESSLLCAE
jgi:transposase-like protein